jgi:hypothetical protein
LHLLSNHPNIVSFPAVINEAIEAQAIVQMAKQDNIMLEPEIGSQSSAATATEAASAKAASASVETSSKAAPAAVKANFGEMTGHYNTDSSCDAAGFTANYSVININLTRRQAFTCALPLSRGAREGGPAKRVRVRALAIPSSAVASRRHFLPQAFPLRFTRGRDGQSRQVMIYVVGDRFSRKRSSQKIKKGREIDAARSFKETVCHGNRLSAHCGDRGAASKGSAESVIIDHIHHFHRARLGGGDEPGCARHR